MPREMKPIALFGIVLVVAGLFGFYFFFGPTPANVYDTGAAERPAILYTLVFFNSLYVAIGVGVLARARWGYVVFKAFLYVLLVVFPIGTALSWLTLRYLRRHSIERYFGVATEHAV